jgi:pilus assembly protein CpaB
MGAARIVILVVAAIAAVGLAVLVRGMMAPQTATAVASAPDTPMARVLVAKEDLAIGTRLTPAHMGWQAWPVEALNANFVTDGAAPAEPTKGVQKIANEATQAASDLVNEGPMKTFEGAIVREPILKGEPMIARKVVRGGEGGYMSVVLGTGMRAVSIPVNSETGAGGFILPGDHVDVLQSIEGDNKSYTTKVLLQNVRVLAIDQTVEPAKDSKTIVGAVATIEVPTSDAGILAIGKVQGGMMLALRPYSEIGGRVGRTERIEDTVRVHRSGETTEVAVR